MGVSAQPCYEPSEQPLCVGWGGGGPVVLGCTRCCSVLCAPLQWVPHGGGFPIAVGAPWQWVPHCSGCPMAVAAPLQWVPHCSGAPWRWVPHCSGCPMAVGAPW